MQTDNAGDLTSQQIREFLLQQGVRLTTISPHVPRQNGACMARDMRAKLATSKLPASYCGTISSRQPTSRRYSQCATHQASRHGLDLRATCPPTTQE
eukprot:3859906-Pleurochrysis_carterae.AAC.2